MEGATAKTNCKGERGSSCLIPLRQCIVLPGTPFISTPEVLEERICFIQDNQFSPKPLAFKIVKIA